MKYLVGDSVVVIAGKDRGLTGVVGKIFAETGRVWVDGVNKKVRHKKGTEGNPGQKVEFFAPIAISNIAYLDPKTKKASRIGYQFAKDGAKHRVSKDSGEKIPTPNSKVEKVAKASTKKPKTNSKTTK